MGVQAGKFRERVSFHRPPAGPDEFGGDLPEGSPIDWPQIGERWAFRERVGGGERLRAAEVGAIVTDRFYVRRDPFTLGLACSDGLVWEGRSYNIASAEAADRMAGKSVPPNTVIVIEATAKVA